MRALVRLAAATMMALSLAACTDRGQTLLQPTGPDTGARALLIPFRPPVNKLGPDQFIAIASGGNSNCARRMDAQVYCWGADDLEQVGRSPNGTCYSSAGTTTPCVYQPTLLKYNNAPLLLTSVDVGSSHACGIAAQTYLAYCWGSGNNGEVGAAPGQQSTWYDVTPVTGGRMYSQISAGSGSTCATTFYYDAIYCWGIVFGSTAGPSLLIQDPNFEWTGISVGLNHVCGIQSKGIWGELRCWGANTVGQAGQPIGVNPVTFSSLTDGGEIAKVSTSLYTTCVDQNQNATAQCFGYNSSGQLGNGQSGSWTSTGTPQTVGNGMILRGVAVGDYHACAIADDKTAWCWGYNVNGQLGNNTLVNSSTPVQVAGGHTYRAVSAGLYHSCGIGTDNVIYCWGNNAKGQLGSYYVTNPKIPNATGALVQ